MELQTVSGERKWVVCFTKQCYDLFCKVNESQTKGVIIKKATHTKWQNLNHRLHKSKYINHHTVHDQRFEINKYCYCAW